MPLLEFSRGITFIIITWLTGPNELCYFIFRSNIFHNRTQAFDSNQAQLNLLVLP